MIAHVPSVHLFATSTALQESLRARLSDAGIDVTGVRTPGPDSVVVVAGSSVDDALAAWPARATTADVRLMVVAETLNPAGLLRAVRAGARTVACTDATAEQLRAAAQSAGNGEGRLPYGVLVRLLSGGAELSMQQNPTITPPSMVPQLTARQLAVLKLVADGHDNNEIARTLSCSKHTVKNVLYELMSRLQVRNRAHAVAQAVRAGLI